jgi:hypothetical protein
MTALERRTLLAGILGGFGLEWLRGPLKQLRAAVDAAKPAADGGPTDAPSDPWTAAQAVQAEDFVKELGETKAPAAERPIVACVGFHVLYVGGHIPGASFHGPGSKEDGLADLKKWAQGLPRSANVAIYCGCCPMARCPNLRPAFTALRDMGFTRLRVLLLPTNFATDWAAKGYPVEKGK